MALSCHPISICLAWTEMCWSGICVIWECDSGLDSGWVATTDRCAEDHVLGCDAGELQPLVSMGESFSACHAVQYAFLFTFVAAKIYAPLVEFNIYAYISWVRGDFSHWAQKECVLTSLVKGSNGWAPLSHDSWSCTFLVLQGPRCPSNLSEVSPRISFTGCCITKSEVIFKLMQEGEPWPWEGEFPGCSDLGKWVITRRKKEARGNQVPEVWLRGGDLWYVSQ